MSFDCGVEHYYFDRMSVSSDTHTTYPIQNQLTNQTVSAQLHQQSNRED